MVNASFGDFGARFDDLFDDAEHLGQLDAQSLDGLLRPVSARTVLDAACGTGIQTIGLARLGYQVAASDISLALVRVVQEKANRQGLAIDVKRSDFRSLGAWRGRRFDAIILCGNSIPLLETDADVDRTLAAARAHLRPGGLLIVGNRDYRVGRDRGERVIVRRTPETSGEWILDLREYGDEHTTVTTLFLQSSNGRRLRTITKWYRTIPAALMGQRLEANGYQNVRTVDLVTLTPYAGGEWYLTVAHTNDNG